MIIVTGSVVAREDSFDEMLAISTEHVRRSRSEPGCISHAVHFDTEEPRRLHFVEQWINMPALWAHFAVPASRMFVDELVRLSAERPTMALYDATEIDELGKNR